ncbi:MAG: ankyrin repeat domain-containing protein, partial [Pyrinomonadaceae bacterium]|nr:ankyrin repeat domain-containing protein [Pyrinomonadaceae bacterium]
AAENGELENVKTLLGAGANAQLKTKEGETALSMTGNAEVKQILIAYGAAEEE